MLISVILPSFNGADTLPETLKALCALEMPECAVEFILIDNNSNDNTRELMDRFARGAPAVVLSEPRQGKSFALNTGIEAASGDLLIFTDDDTIPDPLWLTAYLSASKRHPDCNIFAGQIRPHWIKPPPLWLEDLTNRGQSCGCTEIKPTESRCTSSEVKGANFMVRRRVLGDIRFDVGDVNFGAGTRKIGSEDSKFVSDLTPENELIIYVPDARLKHIIMPDEMSAAKVFQRYMRIGRGSARNSGLEGPLSIGKAIVFAFVCAGACLLFLCLGQRNRAARWMVRWASQVGKLDYVFFVRFMNR